MLQDGCDIVNSPVVDLDKLRAVGRVGDITYWPAGEGKSISIPRPQTNFQMESIVQDHGCAYSCTHEYYVSC